MTNPFAQYRTDGYIPSNPNVAVATLQRNGQPITLPPSVDLRSKCSHVEDQGVLGSCSACALVGALEYWQIAEGTRYTNLSRLFVYYNARRFMETELQDSGATMDQLMAAVVGFGVCAEDLWPYDQDRLTLRPSDDVYQRAIRIPDVQYARVSPDDERKYLLASGYPILFAMSVPTVLFQEVGGKTGYMAKPQAGWEPATGGGHTMLIVGYDDVRRVWIVRNSYGTRYGERGYVYIDYDVMEHYAERVSYYSVGPLEKNQFFSLIGPTTESIVSQTVQAAPPAVQSAVSKLRTHVRQDLESNLEQTRRGLRNRLRGG